MEGEATLYEIIQGLSCIAQVDAVKLPLLLLTSCFGLC